MQLTLSSDDIILRMVVVLNQVISPQGQVISLVMFPGITAEVLCVRVMSLVMLCLACEAGSCRLMSVVMLQDVPGDVGCS